MPHHGLGRLLQHKAASEQRSYRPQSENACGHEPCRLMAMRAAMSLALRRPASAGVAEAPHIFNSSSGPRRSVASSTSSSPSALGNADAVPAEAPPRTKAEILLAAYLARAKPVHPPWEYPQYRVLLMPRSPVPGSRRRRTWPQYTMLDHVACHFPRGPESRSG